ncbi:MAG: hypothetical protein P8Z80_14620 [Pseudolabrys sp.]
MNLGVSFAPLVPAYVVWAAFAAAIVISALLLLTRGRGAVVRAIAMGLMILALANPSFTREDRQPIPSVAAVIVDKSPSQGFGDRQTQTAEAVAAITKELKRIPGLDVRVANAAEATGNNDGTRLFSALSATLADVPPDRVAGAILITDGRVHDVPANAKALGFNAPVQALITGHADEIDRRVVLTETPRFGIVGQKQTIGFRIEDHGAKVGAAEVTVRRDGQVLEKRIVTVHTDEKVEVPIPHAGPNIVEIEAAPLDHELTHVNNRAVVSIDGVRDKLRVLLVSGEPSPGERTWRNLLKSDASVDLVHFTILRPPEKQDGTPINELSLIAFPTRELFQQKISQFQLIIFDRYSRQGVLPTLYFDNIARYVRNGGALLVAAGPDSKLGDRHPVTRGLSGAQTNPPHWSQWFRVIDTRRNTGTVLMQGPDRKPLLELAREGKGRVAMLLSDQIWLWARGYEGGGPQLDLLRRLSHWLMKQPDLEEEALRLTVQGHNLIIHRQTMADGVSPVTLTSPTGKTTTVTLTPDKPGLWQASLPVKELGLWRASDGKLTALTNVGPANPREFQQVTSTTNVLQKIAAETGGSARRLMQGNSLQVPRVVAVRSGTRFAGDDWIGLRMRDVSVVRGIGVLPIFAGLIGLLLLLGSLAATWAREGR